MRAWTSGSWRASQRSLGAVKPGSARLPVSAMSSSRPTSCSISAHSAAVRPSFQRIAGRRTRSPASSATSPCICPVSPMPAIGPARRSCARTAWAPVHQSSGSLLGPAGPRRRQRVRDLGARDDLAVLRHEQPLDGARADVEAREQRHAAGAPSAA